MNKLVVAGLAALCLAPVALPWIMGAGEEFPRWAYPVTPPPRPGGPAPKVATDDATPLHVPDSDVALTRAEIDKGESVADWHPGDHPEMPDIVKSGRKDVRACAYCHLPNGAGRPETASLAGLTENFIKEQIDTFKMGGRKGSDPDRAPQKLMNEIAAKLTNEEITAAAKYFSGLELGSYVKIVETDTVPKTIVINDMLVKAPEGGTEPIGERIVEVPEDLERARNRDPRTSYVAYVPKGSLARGKTFVTGGATPCIACHGPDLHGRGDVPHIAGRSPSYIIRQLYDIQKGKRTGNVAPMQMVASSLHMDDMIAIASYVASLEP
jgi:cytochrome c553